MVYPKKSRKSRNRSNNSVMMSLGSATSFRLNADSLMASLRASQPLNQEWVIWATESLLTSGLSRQSLQSWAQSLVAYPPWVNESMLQNKELQDWIQSRVISLAEHPYWKRMSQL
nr:nonstructural replication protein [Mammalian orthoreovirus 2]UXR75145.1 nonstructural replication protein [Mammalian orthoreovirus 2]UXR75147.1 nonstructural replication protein [Mammalian orthoreovirus 2]